MDCCLNTRKDHVWQFSTAGVPETAEHVQMWLFARHCSACGCVEELAWKGDKSYWKCVFDCEEE